MPAPVKARDVGSKRGTGKACIEQKLGLNKPDRTDAPDPLSEQEGEQDRTNRWKAAIAFQNFKILQIAAM